MEVLHSVFNQAKYFLGTRKDTLLNELSIDVELLKSKIRKIVENDKNKELEEIDKPEERLEYIISSFCLKNSEVKLSEFIQGKYVDDIQKIDNTLSYLENKFTIPPVNLNSIVLSYLPMVVSFISAVVWIIKRIGFNE